MTKSQTPEAIEPVLSDQVPPPPPHSIGVAMISGIARGVGRMAQAGLDAGPDPATIASLIHQSTLALGELKEALARAGCEATVMMDDTSDLPRLHLPSHDLHLVPVLSLPEQGAKTACLMVGTAAINFIAELVRGKH